VEQMLLTDWYTLNENKRKEMIIEPENGTVREDLRTFSGSFQKH
jgi:hypothetical protein